VETDRPLAERLFELSDGSAEQLYRAELEGNIDLYDITSMTGGEGVNYAPDMSAWSVFAPPWTQYSFAIVLDGNSLICAGPPDVQTAEQAIDDCLQTLVAAGDLDEDMQRNVAVSGIDLDTNLPSWAEIESNGVDFSITFDHDVRRQQRIQLALTHPPADFNEIRMPNSDVPAPVAYREDEIIIDGKRCSGEKSPNEEYAIAYTPDEFFLFTTAVLTAHKSIAGLRIGSISNSGVALIAGDLTESDRSEHSSDTDINVNIEIGSPDYSKFNNEVAFYSLEGELLHQEPVPGRIVDGAIDADGTYAALLTELEETTSLHVYDVSDRTKLWKQETRDEHPSQLGEKKEAVTFERSEGDIRIVLSETPDDDPTYAVNLSGEVVWTTDQLVLRDDISGLLTKLEDPEESVPALENTYDSRKVVIQALETIATRHRKALGGHTERLISLLETETVPSKTDAPEEPDPSTLLLYSALGNAPELIEPHLDTLCELVMERADPVAQPATDCLESANKSPAIQETVVRRFEPLFEQTSISVRVLRILEPVVEDLLLDDPSKSEVLAETIRRTTSLENQRTLFRVLKSNISRHQPDAVRGPVAEPTARLYIDLVEVFQEAVASDEQPWKHDEYHNALHSDVGRVLAQVLDVQPTLIDELVESLLKQCLAGTDLDRPATPGNPSELLQLSCVIDESRVRSVLAESRSRVEQLVMQTSEFASVDLLLCLGNEFALEQLRTLASEQQTEKPHPNRFNRIRNRADTAIRLLTSDVTVASSIHEVNLFAPSASNVYFPDDLVTHRAMRVRAHYCLDYLRTEDTAMRGDFEVHVAKEGDPVLGSFEEWWDSIRWILKQLPEVNLNGHTYTYCRS
jgi:hypothetical protein